MPLVGEEILDDPCYRVYQIPALDQGTPYHVRVTAGNMKGYGTPMLSDPAFATPSCEYLFGLEPFSRKITCILFKFSPT